jgi:hypothetical protein
MSKVTTWKGSWLEALCSYHVSSLIANFRVTESFKTKNSFPFLQLPYELRTEVYKHLFSGNRLFPDTTGSRKLRSACRHGLGALEESHSLDVSILQTCRQIHGEAAPILYGANNFAFTTHVICKTCIARQSRAARLDPALSPVIYTDCGLELMYTWLCLIGNTNRALIQKFHVMIDDAAYFYYDGEPKQADDVHPEWISRKPAGEFFGKALELLSKKHDLRQLVIVLAGPDRASLNSHFYYNGMEAQLFKQLVKITGPQFEFCTWPLPEGKSYLELLTRLRVRMEMPERLTEG